MLDQVVYPVNVVSVPSTFNVGSTSENPLSPFWELTHPPIELAGVQGRLLRYFWISFVTEVRFDDRRVRQDVVVVDAGVPLGEAGHYLGPRRATER